MSLIINNKMKTASGIEFSSLTPCESKTIWRGHQASITDVESAVKAARDAFASWSQTELEYRIAICERFAALLGEHKEELASIISAETGKPTWEALTEVGAMINKVAISVRSYHERTGAQREGNLGLSHRPHGVMAVYGPYNFPGHLPNGHIVPALIAGNTIVFKPSELTPATGEFTVKLWLKAGLDTGVLNLVQGYSETGIALSKSDIDGLLFTGSSQTGKLIHRQFGGRPEVMLALEMGGNNALIVSEVKDIERAVEIAINSAFLSAGQRCTCARRLVLVESKDTQAFLNLLITTAKRLIVDGTQPENEPAFMGPVINSATAAKLLEAQAVLSALGANVLLEMKSLDATGVRLSPAIIDTTDVKDIPDEEWFGPLLQVQVVPSLEAAIEVANSTQYGLAAGLVSDNPQEQALFLKTIRAGVTSINAPTAGASSALPFGGVGASGNHRPSAFYASDYCAWPQATMFGGDTSQQSALITKGLK